MVVWVERAMRAPVHSYRIEGASREATRPQCSRADPGGDALWSDRRRAARIALGVCAVAGGGCNSMFDVARNHLSRETRIDRQWPHARMPSKKRGPEGPPKLLALARPNRPRLQSVVVSIEDFPSPSTLPKTAEAHFALALRGHIHGLQGVAAHALENPLRSSAASCGP